MTVDPAVLDLAARILTAKQHEAWKLETQGFSLRVIAFRMNISKTTATDHIQAAHRHLRNHGVRMTAGGTYYLEDTA